MSDSEESEEEFRLCYRIEYCNKTDDPQVMVVVAARNLSDLDSPPESAALVAWKILEAQSRVFFRYPLKTQVGAFYEVDHEVIMCGPFHASEGTAWKVVQESPHSAPELTEGTFQAGVDNLMRREESVCVLCVRMCVCVCMCVCCVCVVYMACVCVCVCVYVCVCVHACVCCVCVRVCMLCVCVVGVKHYIYLNMHVSARKLHPCVNLRT